MKALMSIVFAFVIISPIYILAIWFGPPPLFSYPVDEASEIDVEYCGSDNGLNAGKHRFLSMNRDDAAIHELCNKISKMKLVSYKKSGEYKSRESGPAFKLTIRYRNNSRDVFIGSAGGKWVYRVWGEHGGRIGGINREVFTYVENLMDMNDD